MQTNTEKKLFTVAILGVGSRGADAYGTILNDQKDRFNIVALCDIRQQRLDRFSEIFGVDKSHCFLDENEFFKQKRADVLIIATLDKDHVRQAIKALELGYDILLEKPITDNKDECEQLLAAQKKYGGKVIVCHVLRYAPAFVKASQLIKEGVLGKLVAIDAVERVTFSHQAHSFVRGNWRVAADTAPMILAKCCHDLDLLQHYANSKCKSISSVGDLMFFNKEHAPEGSTARCIDCPHQDTCPYSAKTLYVKWWNDYDKPEDRWPFNIIAPAPLTEEKLMHAVENGPYGRCVFACDNDVVDHQLTQITFENGVKASLTMMAFVGAGGRRMHFYGTHGDILLDEYTNKLTICRFGVGMEDINLEELNEKGFGHGGGDHGIITSLYKILTGEIQAESALESSIESHLMGIYAEESRKAGGKLIYLHK